MSNQFLGTGRRKSSVARVILTSGSGKFLINPLNIPVEGGQVSKYDFVYMANIVCGQTKIIVQMSHL